jgi:hypothetical protein
MQRRSLLAWAHAQVMGRVSRFDNEKISSSACLAVIVSCVICVCRTDAVVSIERTELMAAWDRLR